MVREIFGRGGRFVASGRGSFGGGRGRGKCRGMKIFDVGGLKIGREYGIICTVECEMV